ncbi:hypothetical protein PA598K_03665 [Paenibacillus sp. 598K]|uniref:hypothetical protein n=1 Tax=Paenibacillus sp. 598K TaxID=1117987 RepID=UPI000FF92A05|nr:hypothetical protein [Paenibacillus sp. 598K]GBF75273.1 hypothetical protein PA598K_03665 [Paenibacillus sp. 598K]
MSGQHRIVLPLPLALLLENCRSTGLTDDEIVRCLQARDYAAIEARTLADPAMSIAERAGLAEELGLDWAEVMRVGYEFGFLHLNGLKRLLAFRYRLHAGADYEAGEDRLDGVRLTAEQAEELSALIHRQWLVQPQADLVPYQGRMSSGDINCAREHDFVSLSVVRKVG